MERSRARIIGVVYLFFFVTAVLGTVFIRRAGVPGIGRVSGDATETTNTILAHVPSLRLGFALGLISIACYVAVTALFYRLFKPVCGSLALIAVFVSLMGLAVQAFASLFQLAPLILLDGSPYLRVFDVQQLQALAVMFLRLNVQARLIYLVFDGLFLLTIGYLVVRSTFLPRILGGLVALAGLGWLTLLVPPVADRILPFVEVFGFVAEAALMLWLLAIGVPDTRWRGRQPDGSHG
jgi:hypothetical protein